MTLEGIAIEVAVQHLSLFLGVEWDGIHGIGVGAVDPNIVVGEVVGEVVGCLLVEIGQTAASLLGFGWGAGDNNALLCHAALLTEALATDADIGGELHLQGRGLGNVGGIYIDV